MSPSRSLARLFYAAIFSVVLLVPSVTHGDSSPAVVRVASDAALQAAVQNIQSNTTILIAPGTYQLSATLAISGAVSNVVLRGESENRDDVVLVGPGMTRASYGFVPYGVTTGAGVDGVTIANLTIRDIYFYAIAFGTGTSNPHVDNVRLVDAGAGFIAVNPTGNVPIDEGIIENSLFEYSQTADRSSANGVDIRGGENWLIRANVFRNIVGPSMQPAGAAVLVREHAIGTVVDGNRFSNCWQGIAYGQDGDTPSDHIGGIVRNNMFFRSAQQSGEAGIVITRSPNTLVLNNTVFVSGTYGTPIEYRFAESRDLVLANNLLDGVIWARDGATGDEIGNLGGAAAGLFVNATDGDLHLAANAAAAIDRGVPMIASAADVDGEFRPSGAAYDVGADEFTPGRAGGSRFRAAATSRTMIIAGRVTAANGAGVTGATVKLSGGRASSDTTDRYGFFWFTDVPSGSDYVVTPSDKDGSFTPSSRTYRNASGYVLNANFTKTSGGSTSPANPQVTLTSPAGGTKLKAPASISVSATASAGGGTITKVEFYAGSTKIGIVTVGNGTYSATWSNVIAGFYVIKAVVTTSSGAVASSSTANVTVESAAPTPAPTTPTPTTPTPTTPTPAPVDPSVTLVNPTNGSSANAPANITCTATASGGSGTVTKVQFYNGSTVIGTSTTAPYTISWANVTAGTYSLKAIVTNSAGVSATSPVVTITVTTASTPAPTPTTPTPAASYPLTVVNGIGGGTYLSGATVNISANIPAGQIFAGWSGATVASPSSATTKLVMPAAATTVTASFTPNVTTPTPTPTPIPAPSAPVTTPGSRVNGLSEQCSFSLPAGRFGGPNAGFDYGSSAIVFNPAKGTLLIVGYDSMTAEVAVPACGSGAPSVVANFIDSLEGKLNSVGSGTDMIGGNLIYNGKLYVSDFAYYDGAGSQSLSHFVRPLDLNVKGQVTGPFRVGPLGAGFYSGYMALVPQEWQSALGGPALTGNCCLSIITRTSYGPSVASFDPEHPGAAMELVNYPSDHTTLGGWGATGSHPTYNGNTRIKGLVFPNGTSSVIFTGRTGLGDYCYGEAAACGDPTNSSKGEHGYPYAMYAWAYDANDLAAVRAGRKQPWDVTPYATWTLPGSGNSEFSGASAYDPATGRIFVVEQSGGAPAIIHVLKAQ